MMRRFAGRFLGSQQTRCAICSLCTILQLRREYSAIGSCLVPFTHSDALTTARRYLTSKQPATVPPTDVGAVRPCQRTRQELDQLLKEAPSNDHVNFTRYFFTNVPGTKKHRPRDELDDAAVRCMKCGCTIDEHTSESQTRPEWSAVEYRNILNATEKAKDFAAKVQLLKKSSNWFGFGSDLLLVRDWHHCFWDKFSSQLALDDHRFAIIGTPGTGKTVSLNVFLLWYLQAAASLDPKTKDIAKKRYVVLVLPNELRWILFDTEKKMTCEGKIGKLEEALEPIEKQLLVLHDIGNGSPITSRTLPTVIATSPKYEKYNEFMKGEFARHFYAPLYTDEEMDFAAQKVFPNCDYTKVWPGDPTCTTWQRAAYYFGNVPRHVFSSTPDEGIKVELQCKTLDFATFLSVFRPLPEPTPKVNDRLVEYVPTPEFDGFSIRLRSGYVTHCVATRHWEETARRYYEISEHTRDGSHFESVIHSFLVSTPNCLPPTSMKEMFKSGGSGPASALPQDLWPTTGVWKRANFPPSATIEFETRRYYVPDIPNYPLVDSFIFCPAPNGDIDLLCFQMTIADRHPPRDSTLRKFIIELEKSHQVGIQFNSSTSALEMKNGKTVLPLGLHIVFVLRHEHFENFQYQLLEAADRKKGVDSEMQSVWDAAHQYKGVITTK